MMPVSDLADAELAQLIAIAALLPAEQRAARSLANGLPSWTKMSALGGSGRGAPKEVFGF
jgi:hypothetical protein